MKSVILNWPEPFTPERHYIVDFPAFLDLHRLQAPGALLRDFYFCRTHPYRRQIVRSYPRVAAARCRPLQLYRLMDMDTKPPDALICWIAMARSLAQFRAIAFTVSQDIGSNMQVLGEGESAAAASFPVAKTKFNWSPSGAARLSERFV